MATDIIYAEAIGKEICEALDIDSGKVARIILDIAPGEPLRAYVEMLGGSRFLNIKWGLVGKAKIEFSDTPTTSRSMGMTDPRWKRVDEG